MLLSYRLVYFSFVAEVGISLTTFGVFLFGVLNKGKALQMQFV